MLQVQDVAQRLEIAQMVMQIDDDVEWKDAAKFDTLKWLRHIGFKWPSDEASP